MFSKAILWENWQPNVPIDLNQLQRLGMYNDLFDLNVDLVKPTNFPDRNKNDLVNSISTKGMFYAIAGSGGNVNNVWASPETFLHFADNIKSQYPGQLINLNDLFIAYLIQLP